MGKFNHNHLLNKGFIGIPILIIALIMIGIWVNVSADHWSFFSFADATVMPLYSTIWKLEVFPLVVAIYSLVMLLKQVGKTRRYRRRFPKGSYNTPLKYLKFVLGLPKRYFIPQLAYVMMLLWSIGWGLYMLALWSNYESDSNMAELLGYSAMASLDLFLLDINGNILDNIGRSIPDFNASVLKGSIVVTSIISACCSFSLLIRLFLHSLLSAIHTSSIKVSDTTTHLYLFFGINDKSLSLAKSIKKGDAKSLVIFIEQATTDTDETDGIQNILHIVSPASSMRSSVELDEKTIHLYSTGDLAECSHDCDFWLSIGLETVDKMISDLCERPDVSECQLKVFFMSEDRDKNVSDSKNIIEAFKNICKHKERFKAITKTVYSQTRRESATSVIEDKNVDIGANLSVRLIDDSELAISHLRKELDDNPVAFVDIDTTDAPGAVASAFTSLIVGFGETGRDAFRFLYEFGSFIGPAIDRKRQTRSPFECHIVDNNIDSIIGVFKANAPSIFGLDLQKKISDKNTLEFHGIQDNSESFHNLLEELSDRLNYVVVSTGDDERNITTAIRILKYVRRHKRTGCRLKIFVRAYDKGTFSHLEGLVRYYNDLYGHDYLKIFGSAEDIYTYDSIVVDKAIEEAAIYHETYSSVAEKEYPPMDGESRWSSLVKSLDYDFYLKAHGHVNDLRAAIGLNAKKPLSKSEALFDIRRQIKENCKNSLHAPTKIRILQHALDVFNRRHPELTPLSIDRVKSALENTHVEWGKRLSVLRSDSVLPDFTEEQSTFVKKLVLNLCRTEHLRWNSSHELQGFKFDGIANKDFTRLTHNCLLDWADLDKYTPIYDYLVIETSIKLAISPDSRQE